jgi:alpha-tubulin suppressor-like RCC1 family protein
VLCWGGGLNGELGDGKGQEFDIPVQVAGLSSGVIEIAPGTHHNCAVTSAGGLMCWGFNSVGQLGNGKTGDELVPVAVLGVGGVGLLKLF